MRTGSLNKPVIMKYRIQVEYNMRRNRAIQENVKGIGKIMKDVI